MSRERDFEDDGRTIAPMNVEGMPWFTPERNKSDTPAPLKEELRGENLRAFRRGVLKATLMVGGAYALVFLIFILFCLFVWFR